MTAKKPVLLIFVGALLALLIGTAGVIGFRIGAGGLARNDSPASKGAKDAKSKSSTSESSGQADMATGRAKVTLYFADSQGMFLLSESRAITADNLPKATLEALINGPQKSGHNPTIPPSMMVTELQVENGLATVDFGAAFNALIPRGTTGERLFIYSIVNSLTALKGIKKVKFMAGGTAPSVEGSRTDFGGEFVRNEDIIEQ